VGSIKVETVVLIDTALLVYTNGIVLGDTSMVKDEIVMNMLDVVTTLGSTVLDNGIIALAVNVAWRFVIIVVVVELTIVNDAAVEYTSLLDTHVYCVDFIHFPLARLKVHSVTSLLTWPPKIKPSALTSGLHST